MRDISKRFPGVLALDNVSLSIERGEVHALLGENGAGKSTLMKILSGAYKKDAGEIIFDGQPVQINSPRQAQELGVSIIYQELNLVPQLSVAENIFLSSLPMKNPACIDWKHVYSDAQTIIDSLDQRQKQDQQSRHCAAADGRDRKGIESSGQGHRHGRAIRAFDR